MVASSMFAISLKTGPWRPSPFDDAAPPARSLLFHSHHQTVRVPWLGFSPNLSSPCSNSPQSFDHFLSETKGRAAIVCRKKKDRCMKNIEELDVLCDSPSPSGSAAR